MFCNSPYSKKTKDNPGQEAWIEKCYKESSENGAIVVMLIPARTDTKAFHKYILGKAKEIRFIEGRLKFEIERKSNKDAAPFPSMIVIYNAMKDRGGFVIPKVVTYKIKELKENEKRNAAG